MIRARVKVIDSLSAAIIAKYSLVMTPTPCRVAGCIISIRSTYSCAGAFTHIITYTVCSCFGEYITFINLYSPSTTSLMHWSSANCTGSSIYKIKMFSAGVWNNQMIGLVTSDNPVKHSSRLDQRHWRHGCRRSPVGDGLWCSFVTFQQMLCLPFHCLW